MHTMIGFSSEYKRLNPIMQEDLLEFSGFSEPIIRLIIFVFIFIAIIFLEIAIPRRELQFNQKKRWLQNLGIALLNIAILRLLFPFAAVGIAIYAENQSLGILMHLDLPLPVRLVCGFLMLDMCIYWQHRLFHHIPLLWRLHKIHHTDADFDLTTGLRFHPIEILLSMMIKTGAIIVIGPPVMAVLLFEILLSSSALFTHGNFTIMKALERFLRTFIVTPEMHRIHHSVLPEETNSNFAFNISLWDRLFRTYRAESQDDQTTMRLGLKEYADFPRLTLLALLLMPFHSSPRSSSKEIP